MFFTMRTPDMPVGKSVIQKTTIPVTELVTYLRPDLVTVPYVLKTLHCARLPRSVILPVKAQVVHPGGSPRRFTQEVHPSIHL
jgi:hypothetical protein